MCVCVCVRVFVCVCVCSWAVVSLLACLIKIIKTHFVSIILYILIKLYRKMCLYYLITGVQSQVESFQKLKKWYLMPPCLTLTIIRYRSRVKWSNQGNGVAPSLTPWCSSYWKGSLQVTFNYSQPYIYIYIYILSSRQTVSLYHNFSLFARHTGHFRMKPA